MLGWLFRILSINQPGVNRREFLQTTLAAGAALSIPDLFAKTPDTSTEAAGESTLILEPDLQGVLTKGKKSLPSPVDAFLGKADQIIERMPKLDMLYLNNAGGGLFGIPWNLDKLAKSPHLRRFKTLFLLKCHVPLSQYQALFKSPHLVNLETLVIHHERLGDLGANAIADGPALKNLKRLSLWYNDIGPAGMRALSLSKHLANLQELEFAHSFLGDDGARWLAAAPHWSRLTDMLLLNNGITAQGAKEIAATRQLASLKNFGLMDQMLGKEGQAILLNRFGPVLWLEESEYPEEPYVKAIYSDPARLPPRLRYADWLDQKAGALPARQANQITEPSKQGPAAEISASRSADSPAPGLQKLARLEAAGRALAAAQTVVRENENAPDDEESPDPRTVRARALRLLRVQCELHGMHVYDPAFQEKLALTTNLQSAYGDDWTTELAESTWPYSDIRKPMQLVEEFFGLQREKLSFFHFHRGMVEGLSCPADEFLKNGPALCRENPLLAKLDLYTRTDSADTIKRLAASPLLKRLNYLHVFQCEPARLKALMESPHLAGVRWFGIQQSEVHADACKTWLASPRLAGVQFLTLRGCTFAADQPFTLGDCARLNQVTELDLGSSSFPENGLVALLGSPHLGNIKSLNLGGLSLTDEEMEALVTSVHLKSLQFLNLEGVSCSNDWLARLGNAAWASQLVGLSLAETRADTSVLEAIAQSPGFAQLQGLNLRQTDLLADGVRALANAPFLAKLRFLDVGATGMEDEGLLALIESPILKQLGHLEIHQNNLTDAGIAQLGASPWCQSLQSLVLSGNAFGADGTAKIATSSNLARLRYLSMRNIAMGPAGAKALCRSPALRELTVLRLASCQLEDIGATAMAVGNLPKLQVLYLNDNQIGERGAGALARSTPLENLIGLDLQGNDVGEEAKEALRAQYGYRVRLDRWSMMQVGVDVF